MKPQINVEECIADWRAVLEDKTTSISHKIELRRVLAVVGALVARAAALDDAAVERVAAVIAQGPLRLRALVEAAQQEHLGCPTAECPTCYALTALRSAQAAADPLAEPFDGACPSCGARIRAEDADGVLVVVHHYAAERGAQEGGAS